MGRLGTRRSRYEIVWEVLDYCREPRKVTQIVQACNLNSESVKGHLTLLVSKHLLRFTADYYETTEDGHRYLRTIEGLYDNVFS